MREGVKEETRETFGSEARADAHIEVSRYMWGVACVLEASVTATEEPSRGQGQIEEGFVAHICPLLPLFRKVQRRTYFLARLLTGQGAAGNIHAVGGYPEWEWGSGRR